MSVEPLTFSSDKDKESPLKLNKGEIQWPSQKRKAQQTGNVDIVRQWQSNPTPENGAALLEHLKPHIEKAVRHHTGSVSPVNLGTARVMVMKSMDRYNPTKSSVQTYVNQQLWPLHRLAAKRRSGVKVPVSYAHEAKYLQTVEAEFEAENGRLPSRAELADHSGMPLSRIEKVTTFRMPSIAEKEYQSEEGSGTAGDAGVEDDGALWQKTVYHSLNPVNQFIMEHTTGLYGSRVMSNRDIANKLKISPSAVSQRKAHIQKLLNEQ